MRHDLTADTARDAQALGRHLAMDQADLVCYGASVCDSFRAYVQLREWLLARCPHLRDDPVGMRQAMQVLRCAEEGRDGMDGGHSCV